ncbi:MAG: hypothetical protein ACOYT4_03920 [Nanoarchaeota archaeon]
MWIYDNGILKANYDKGKINLQAFNSKEEKIFDVVKDTFKDSYYEMCFLIIEKFGNALRRK